MVSIMHFPLNPERQAAILCMTVHEYRFYTGFIQSAKAGSSPRWDILRHSSDAGHFTAAFNTSNTSRADYLLYIR